MSGHVEISAALVTHLTAVAPGAAITASKIKYENLDPNGQTFVPASSGFWYQAWFLPGEPHAAGIGEQAPNRHVGIFQVDVYGLKGKGTKATDDEAERIRTCYKRGTALTYSSTVVYVEKSWVQRPEQDDAAYFKQIVRIQWSSDIAN